MITRQPDSFPYWCQVCGARAIYETAADVRAGNLQRCEKHAERNPCAIEGCRRSTEAPRNSAGQLHLANDQWLCSEHWRRFVPPRSKRRRAYHAFFRRARRDGWTPKLERRFWRFWDTLVASARQRATEGFVDEAAINRLFGWDQEGDG